MSRVDMVPSGQAFGRPFQSCGRAGYGTYRGGRAGGAGDSGRQEAIGGLVAGIKRKQVADAVGKLAARFDSFLVRRRSGFKTRHDAEKDYGVRAAVTRAMVKVGDRVRHVDYGPATVTKVEKNGAIHIKTEAGDTGTTTVGSLRKL